MPFQFPKQYSDNFQWILNMLLDNYHWIFMLPKYFICEENSLQKKTFTICLMLNKTETNQLLKKCKSLFITLCCLHSISNISDRPGSLPPLLAGCWALRWRTCCCDSGPTSGKVWPTSADSPGWAKTTQGMSCQPSLELRTNNQENMLERCHFKNKYH